METETRPTHPQHIGTAAATCGRCYGATYGVALDCAYDNIADPDDHALAEQWARMYVETDTVSAYYCVEHDPINAVSA